MHLNEITLIKCLVYNLYFENIIGYLIKPHTANTAHTTNFSFYQTILLKGLIA